MTSHGTRFAKQALPDYVFDNPLSFARAIADPARSAAVLATVWEKAGAQIPAGDRQSPAGLRAQVMKTDDFAIVHVLPPVSDATCAILIVGHGDGVNAFDSIVYYVVEPRRDGTGATRFVLVSRKDDEETEAGAVEAPQMIGRALALASGQRAEVPETPIATWYWWHVYRGADVMRAFHQAPEAHAWNMVHQAPILLLPELCDAAEQVLGFTRAIHGLRQMQSSLAGSQYEGAFLAMLANALANEPGGTPRVNGKRALAVIQEARQRGVRSAELDAAESTITSKLSRSSATDLAQKGDPAWHAMFLDDLQGYTRSKDQRDAGSTDREFTKNKGSVAGSAEWTGPDTVPVYKLLDERWVFPTAKQATAFMQAISARPVDGLLPAQAPPVADAQNAWGLSGRTKQQMLMFRIGRVVARLTATEGPRAAAIYQLLQQEHLLPYAHHIVKLVRYSLARYWLGICRGSEAVASFMQEPPRTQQTLFTRYPVLLFHELPTAMAALGDQQRAAAEVLIQQQGKLKTQWQLYRDTLRALVRELLDEQAGDRRVNADAALGLVVEHRRHDQDYSWAKLENECRERA